MIDYKYGDLFNKSSISKQISIAFDDGKITNADLYSENFELTESLCSESELHFGSCEASMLKFRAKNAFGQLKGKWLDVSTVIDGKADAPFRFGRYKAVTEELSGDRKYKDITAYDAMYDVINADVVEWYDLLAFPLTVKEFRDSFFSYLGVEQEDVSLINDDVLVEKTVDADSISGKMVAEAICELNGCFGHINRDGTFTYVFLGRKAEFIHPGKDIHPEQRIHPGLIIDLTYGSQDIPGSQYQSCEYADFETQLITKVQVRQESGDIGAIAGNGANCYVVEDNFLVYGKEGDELTKICRRILGQVMGVQYRPFKATIKGNPCIEVGDMVCIRSRLAQVEGYVLERTLKGIQSLKDSIEAKGVYEYAEKVNSSQREIKRLKGKTNVLTRSVEETKMTISDMEKAVSTTIKQLADSISITVDENGNIKTSLELDKNGMSFKGNKVVFGFDNFKLDEAGNVDISGVFRNKAGSGEKAVEIQGTRINFYSWEHDDSKNGTMGATYAPSLGADEFTLAAIQGKRIGLGYSNDGGTSIQDFMYYDTTEDESTRVPHIRNTYSGTVSVIAGLSWSGSEITGVTRRRFVIESGLIVETSTYQDYP